MLLLLLLLLLLLPSLLLQAQYPAANISLVNLARGGHDVQAAATCWYQLAPQVSFFRAQRKLTF